MVTEIALLTIDPAQSAGFEAAVAAAAPLFQAARGCRHMSLERVIERPGQYRLVVQWESVEAHMVDFRESPAFAQWRALAGPFFTGPVDMVHSEAVGAYF